MTTLAERPIGKLLPTRFIWKIDNFSKLEEVQLYYSDDFIIGGCKWNLWIDPKFGKTESLGLFLGIADSSAQPKGWSVEAEFSLALIDQVSKKSIVRNEECRFAARNCYVGYCDFITLGDLHRPEQRYLVNDSCVVEVGISVRKVVCYRMYDESKKEATGGPLDAAAPAKQKSDVLETAKKTEDASATSLKQKPKVDKKPVMDTDEAVRPDVPLIKIPRYRRLGGSGYSKESDGYGSVREVKKLAYHFVLQSLYLQGDHKWKNEVWFTELRGALGVSNDDHVMELKRVISGEPVPMWCHET